jgi:hypothetical protein
MQTRDYFHWAHRYMRDRREIRNVSVKCHPTETSLLEGVFSRGDRRVAPALELAWQRGARLDSWSENLQADRWWQALADCNVDTEAAIHRPFDMAGRLPWDHINVKKGRAYLEKEHQRATVQLAEMAGAT